MTEAVRSYTVTLTGKTPLLMHSDNIEWADEMEAWKNSPANRKGSKAGDDRSPAHRWIGSLYHDGRHIGLPADVLMKSLQQGGAMVPVPGGKNGKTFKAQTQSGLIADGTHWPILVAGKPIDVAPILALQTEPAFERHQSAAEKAGFSLFLKRAKIGAQKHVRVRPRFDTWSARGSIRVWDKAITRVALVDILTYAGLYKGVGDWRPSSPAAPGTFGMFDVTIDG